MIKSVPRLQWYGKPKFHYVVKYENSEIYRCTSVAKYQEDVLEVLISRFKRENGLVSIFCNGSKVCVLKGLKIAFKSIY